MTLRIYVGYRLTRASLPGEVVITPPAAALPPGPFSRSVASASLWDPDHERALPGCDDPLALSAWLLAAVGPAPGDGFGPRRPPFVLVGFEPAAFLAALVGDCARAKAQLPHRYWHPFAQTTLDLTGLLSPADPAPAAVVDAVSRLRPAGFDPTDGWYARFAGWAGPGVSPADDVRMAATVGTLLGFRDDHSA